MDWDDFRVLLAASREGSASRAARALGVTVSTVTRRLSQLEAACGGALFARTPQGLQITPAGAALLPWAEAAERAIFGAAAAVDSLGETPKGTVRVTLPQDVLCSVVLPQFSTFLDRYPEVEVIWMATPKILDLSRREADIALRTPRPTQGDDLLIRCVRRVPVGVYGTQRYLDTVAEPADLPRHRWITINTPQWASTRWVREVIGGRVAMQVDDAVALRLAVACDLGVAVLPRVFAELTPGLVALPVDVTLPPAIPVYAITHRAVRHAPAVAAVWEFLIANVGDDPDRDDVAILDDLHRRYFR